MPGESQQSQEPDLTNEEKNTMYGCPLFIVGFIILLIVLALFFL